MLAAVTKWLDGLDKKDPDYEHNVLEALWVYQNQDSVNPELLKRVLASRIFGPCSNTVCICYWRDNLPTLLDILFEMRVE